MTDESIREAISWAEKELKKFENANNQCIRLLHTGEIAIDERDYLPIFITLAQQYLDAGEEVEEKKYNDDEFERGQCSICGHSEEDTRRLEVNFFNTARSQCLLILVKKEEEIRELKESSTVRQRMRFCDKISDLETKLSQMSKAARVEKKK